MNGVNQFPEEYRIRAVIMIIIFTKVILKWYCKVGSIA